MSVDHEHWKNDPDEQDFPAAESYLSLLVGPADASRIADALRKQQSLTRYAAKDLLRASGLPLLAHDDSEVRHDLDKIKDGKKLSPVLLVYGEPPWVADGYHRICASYYVNEKTLVPCRVVGRSS